MPIATKSSKIDITQESVTASLAKKFSKVFKNGDIVFLYGEIGVGKTTFVKYLINSFQQKNKDQKTEVTSPTFSILNEYQLKNLTINHFDLFRTTVYCGIIIECSRPNQSYVRQLLRMTMTIFCTCILHETSTSPRSYTRLA